MIATSPYQSTMINGTPRLPNMTQLGRLNMIARTVTPLDPTLESRPVLRTQNYAPRFSGPGAVAIPTDLTSSIQRQVNAYDQLHHLLLAHSDAVSTTGGGKTRRWTRILLAAPKCCGWHTQKTWLRTIRSPPRSRPGLRAGSRRPVRARAWIIPIYRSQVRGVISNLQRARA